ncbi:pentatricopeptide repeat-containing protein 2, mitochondrial isoform X2 [Gouania willdenowi]|uniref:pentatricopeptide repeat-containing protein 2, mitochondrial isoform X2 n=1 Tax=Gouania willdenowi TaxID=441366 RepID=UPI0010563535|nr:pentatricopeptide repeat-containing protein 2, mitochondrial isoform X2 [Gouania willdenowi]
MKKCNHLRVTNRYKRLTPKRHLLSEDVIKLQDFQRRKLAVAHLATGTEGNFIELFHQKLQRKELILRDELKLLLHLCQSADDMMIARDAIQRYHMENCNLLYGDFKFGPLFMRLCYELGLEDMAANTLADDNLKGFFIDTTSFNIAIDMLFIKGLYEEALEVVKTMRNQSVPFNKETVMLATATCYKLDSAESYRISSILIEEEQTRGNFISRLCYCFAVALALRRNDLKKAQSVFGQIMSTESIICQNLKVILLVMSGDVEDAISVLSSAMSTKTPDFVKKTEFSQEVVDLLLLRSDGKPTQGKVEQTVALLNQNGQVTQQTLDDLLCRTPTGRRKQAPMKMGERRISRRTGQPLQTFLISE